MRGKTYGFASVARAVAGRVFDVAGAVPRRTLSLKGAGTHGISCVATDVAGNTSAATVISVTVVAARRSWLNSDPIQFGKAVVSNPACGGVQSINIRNEGPVALTLDALAVSGLNADDFTITNGAGPITLAVQQTHAVLVKFCPAATGGRTAMLSLSGGNLQGGTASIVLTGTGRISSMGRGAVTRYPHGHHKLSLRSNHPAWPVAALAALWFAIRG